MKTLIKRALGIALGIFILSISIEYGCVGKTDPAVPKPTITVYSVEDTLSVENLFEFIVESDIECPLIVLKQSLLETGRFTSYQCKKNNNLFGFRTEDGYLKFRSWQESVSYYKRWQAKRYHGGNYYTFLENINYAEDTLYCKTLKNMRL